LECTLFATGFLFRPLGALIFGYIGDKYGRKKSLVLSVSLTGAASLGMCLVPSYDLIGVASCYIIVLIRVIQGISVGGEYSGAIIFAVEHFDNKKAGFVGSFIVSGCLCGVLLATLVSSIVKLPYVPEYSWRFAFLLGFFLSIGVSAG
jgi:MHS family proline/betaine transporter-like MFS transporter